VPIAVIATVAFGVGMHVYLRLRGKGFESVPEETWRHWIEHAELRRGPIGDLLSFVTGGTSLRDTSLYFDQLRTTETAPFERDLRVMRICVNAAPLVGLLGTVTGMLATFGALATGGGGEQTMGLVTKGISVALITTETGLVIALPGLFFQYQLVRKLERYKAFLAHLETACTQSLYSQLRTQDRAIVRRAAQLRVARALLQRLNAPRPVVKPAS
jgi:biopolymer transport protein ExbB